MIEFHAMPYEKFRKILSGDTTEKLSDHKLKLAYECCGVLAQIGVNCSDEPKVSFLGTGDKNTICEVWLTTDTIVLQPEDVASLSAIEGADNMNICKTEDDDVVLKFCFDLLG